METVKKWSELTWQEKREERFKRWLSPLNVKFVSPAAEKLYKARVTRFIQAIKMEEPDRVPVMLPVGNFPAYYAGVDYHTVIYDYQEMRRAWLKFMDEFGDMDYFRGPSMVISGRLSDALELKNYVWPGHGLPIDASMSQFVEGEYMHADEYDRWLNDPSDYNIRFNLPRTAGVFAPFKNLPPLRSLQGAGWIGILADPQIRQSMQTMMDLSADYQQWQAVNREIGDLAVARGYATFRSGGIMMAGAPFDHFADSLRGTRGITMDMYRQPGKLHEAMERHLTLTINTLVKNAPMSNCPIVMMPLHKGDDMFMSAKQFETFYWPYLRRLCLAMMEEGLVPMPFAEGRYTNRLSQIADTPRSGVVWYFDQTDMTQAKKILGNISCLVGNVPTSLVMTSTPAQVKEHCKNLIETCGPGGGYILAGGASIDKGNIENLRAMMQAAYEYGVYR